MSHLKKKAASSERSYIEENTEYFRLDKAAHLLGCAPADLLHLGTQSKLQIIAPVLAAGTYIWNINPDEFGFPEIEGDVTHFFDAAERVLLSWIDLAKIEAVGWTTPKHFYAPSKAEEIDQLLITHLSAVQIDDEIGGCHSLIKTEDNKAIMSLTYHPSKKAEFNEELLISRKQCYYAPWYIAELPEGTEKTTVHHLFISKEEIERIKSNQPDKISMPMPIDRKQPVKKEHGLVEYHAKRREEILMAAIYCQHNFFKSKIPSFAEWARNIDEKAALFWKDTGTPPLGIDIIERLLSSAVQHGKRQNAE